MCSNTKKLKPVVVTKKTGILMQGGGMENKAYSLNTRYAAFEVTSYNYDTRIMEYEEIGD